MAVATGDGANAISTVKDNGTSQSTFAEDGVYNDATNGYSVYVYRADGISLPASGSYIVTITLSPAKYVTAAGYSYTGVKAGAPAGTNNGASTTGSNSVATGAVTPASAGALYFALATTDSSLPSETITLTGAGFAEQATENDGAVSVTLALADKIDSGGPASTQCTWTLGDTVNWDALIAVYDAIPVPPSLFAVPQAVPGLEWPGYLQPGEPPVAPAAPFAQPGRAASGRPAARRGGTAGSSGASRQTRPSPFPQPGKPVPAHPAARKGSSARLTGRAAAAPPGPVHPAVPGCRGQGAGRQGHRVRLPRRAPAAAAVTVPAAWQARPGASRGKERLGRRLSRRAAPAAAVAVPPAA